MKLTKEQKNSISDNFNKNLDKRITKTNIIGMEEVDTSTFIGVKLMAKKKETPPEYFVTFANEVRSFMQMQIEFNKNQMAFNDWVKNEITQIKQDIVELKQDVAAIKACPTIKRELSLFN